MTGYSSRPTCNPSTPKVSLQKPTDQDSAISCGADPAPESNKAVNDRDLPNPASGPELDGGCYPAQRRRQGDRINCVIKPSAVLTTGSIAPGLSPLALEESPYTPPAAPVDASTNVENVLPSPSPSVEARQRSHHGIEINGDGNQPQAAEAQTIKAPTATFEELVTRCGGIDQLEKLLKDAGKSNYGPSQIAASAVAQELPSNNSSSHVGPQLWPPGSQHQSRSQSDHDIPVTSIANKRPQEVTNEPRKRLHSLPCSMSGKHNGLSSANTVLADQNGQSRAAMGPVGNGMRHFAQALAQRIQLVAKLPDRGCSHIEQPRLGLLREACENSDHFYLILHQLFCFNHKLQKSGRQVPGLNDMHREGLDKVAYLLVSNEQLAEDAVAWFSVFPLPWLDLHLATPEFLSAYPKVLRCLEGMAKFWTDMRSQCNKRKYPPLVDELLVLFNAESFQFQQIIFRAVLRDIWSGKSDGCFQISEALFNRDHQAVLTRLSSGNTSNDFVNFYQQTVIRDYQQTITSHWQHTVAELPVNMAAPVQQQGQPSLAQANHPLNNRNKSQSELHRNTQTPLTLDLHTAQRPNSSAAPSPASIGIQAPQFRRQSHFLSQSEALVSNALPSPQSNRYTQSPTTMHPFFSPGGSMNLPWQWNNQQQQSERRTSSTAGILRSASGSTTPSLRTAPVLPSNVPGNPQFQQTIVPQQQYPNPLFLGSAHPGPHPQSEVRRSFSNQANEAILPTPCPPSSMQSTPSLPTHMVSTPFIRIGPPLPAHADPTRTALHQAHLRSPTLTYIDPNKDASSTAKCYRFISHVILPPKELDSRNRHVIWDFNVNKELTDWFARDAPSSRGAPPMRAVAPGSRLSRIRCVSLQNKAGMPTQSEWAVADNVWPSSTAVILNGTALDIRKKSHHGKDLPIDVTRYIKAGRNNLSTAVIGSTSRYAIGVEFVRVVDEQKIRDEIKCLSWLEARNRILDQSKNLDPDVEIIQSHKVLDLTDPFTARIFEVPVRGINCHHNQCFDRDTFLQTRTAKGPGEPCGPDEFRCPICSQDARPQSLMIDLFFVGIRMTLKERDRLDVKAVILQDSGDWEIKEEEEATGESGDGRSRETASVETASARVPSQSIPREVIELDDD